MGFLKKIRNMKKRWQISSALAVAVLLPNIYFLFTSPTNDGPWSPVYEKLASVEIREDLVTINNVRRARYNDQGQPREIVWDERTVNLGDLTEVWFGISVFSDPGIGHTFLSFDFGDGDPIVVSVEARMRPDQRYHPFAGALDKFHLIYTIADERDVVDVRVHGRPDEVYFHHLTISKEFSRELFMDMINRTNSLHERPEFYNTFTSNCTNNLLNVTTLPTWRRYLDPRIVLPGYSDRVAYEYDIIDTRYPFDLLRDAAHINPEDFSANDPEFSAKIRAKYYETLRTSE